MRLPSQYPWTIDSKVALAIPEINYGIDGSKLQDFSQNSHKGTNNGTVTVVNDAKLGRVLNFSSAYISIPHHASFNITNQLFLMVWIFPTSFGGNNQGGIFNKKSNLSDSFQLRLLNTSSSLNFVTGGTSHAVAAGITLNQWQLVGSYYDKDLGSNQITYFRNNAIVGNATETAAIVSNSYPLIIGNGNGQLLNVAYAGRMARPFIAQVPNVDEALRRIRDEYARFS